jgi:elongation factor 2
MAKILWGEWFFDSEKKQFINHDTGFDKNKARGFCKFIMSPIMNMYNAIDEVDLEKVSKICKKYDIILKEEDLAFREKDLIKKVFI